MDLPIAIAAAAALLVVVFLLLVTVGVRRGDRAELAVRPASPLAALTRRVVGLYVRRP